jgi:hypothetical protein
MYISIKKKENKCHKKVQTKRVSIQITQWTPLLSLQMVSLNFSLFFMKPFAVQQKPANKNKTHSTLLVLSNPNQQNA